MARKPSNLSKEVAARIVEAKPAAFNDTDWAAETRLTPQIIHNYRNGSGASLKAVASVIKHTRVNPRWLLTGDGPMRLPKDEDPTIVHQDAVKAVLTQTRDFLAKLEQEHTGEPPRTRWSEQ